MVRIILSWLSAYKLHWGALFCFHLTNDAPALQADGTNANEIKDWQINRGKLIATMVNSAKKSMVMCLSKFNNNNNNNIAFFPKQVGVG